jgi:hypothetical protein
MIDKVWKEKIVSVIDSYALFCVCFASLKNWIIDKVWKEKIMSSYCQLCSVLSLFTNDSMVMPKSVSGRSISWVQFSASHGN